MAKGPLVHALVFPDATAVPGTPASGEAVLYAEGGALKVKDDTGTVTTLGSGGGGSGLAVVDDDAPLDPETGQMWWKANTTQFFIFLSDEWAEVGSGWAAGGGGDPDLGGDLTGTASDAQIAAGVIVNADINASAAIAVSKLALVAGAGLGLATDTLSVNVDDTTIEVNTDTLRLKDGGVTSAKIADGTIVNADVNGSAAIAVAKLALVAGAGLGLATDTLSVNVDDSSIEINADTLRVKASGITSAMIADGAIVNADINGSAAIAVSKLALVAGAALVLTGDTLDVGVDGSTIEVNTDALRVKALGITNSHINASAAIATSKLALVAGNGLGLATDTLSVNVDDTGIEINSDTLRLKDGGVTSAKIADGTIVNADINGSAAIALSKLATDPLARANHTGTQAASTITGLPVALGIAVSDETTTVTSTGNPKVTFRMPHAMTVTAVRASLTTASSSGAVTVDINEAGSTILSTKLTIDQGATTSVGAATPPVISDSALADDAAVTIDIDGAGTGAKGLKVWLIGTR